MRYDVKNNRYDIKYMVFMFCFLALMGGVLEISYMIITEQRFVIGGFFNAPIRPIYGFGGLIIYLLPNVLKRNIWLIFFSSFIACSTLEYLTSFFIETIFNKQMWDYSNFIFDINGRVCLFHSCLWGILGVLFVSIIIPYILRIYNVVFEKTLKKIFN